MSKPRTGDGYMGGHKPHWRDLFMRRSSAASSDLPSDIQPLATSRFQKAAGRPKDARQKKTKGWF